MRKPRLVAVIAAITLVGCGSTRTVNLTSFGSTAASSSSASSRVPGGMRGTASAVAACLKAAGAAVRGPQAAGEGFADYATTRDGGNVGFVQAGDALNIKAIGKVFARAGDHITTLKKDPTAFTFYKNWQTSMDSDLLRKCTARLSFRSTPASSSSGSSTGVGGISSPVAACFKAAGAYVKGPQAAGPGSAIYVVTRDAANGDGANMGFVKGPDASTLKAIGKVFTQGGGHITMLKKDPTAFVFYKGTLSKRDSDLLRTCSARR